MPSRKRQGNDPKRRIAPPETISDETRSDLAKARYVGSAHHKSKLSDYSFIPPVNPRPGKSLCDDRRVVSWKEAVKLFHSGAGLGMISGYLQNGLPKFVWAMDHAGEAYEAKLGDDGSSYHGYRLSPDDRMREYIIAEWQKRNQ